MKSMQRVALMGTPALLLSTAALAQEPSVAASDEAEIIVTGRGETRQVQQISQADIAPLAAGTTALKALEKLPSVNFQSADAFGAYEWSQRITVRGFDQSRLGFTLDGLPLGNQNYGNVNGLHTNRAISPENVGTIRLTQGAGSLGTQATNNLGGTIELASRDPSKQFGADGNSLTAATTRSVALLVSIPGAKPPAGSCRTAISRPTSGRGSVRNASMSSTPKPSSMSALQNSPGISASPIAASRITRI